MVPQGLPPDLALAFQRDLAPMLGRRGSVSRLVWEETHQGTEFGGVGRSVLQNGGAGTTGGWRTSRAGLSGKLSLRGPEGSHTGRGGDSQGRPLTHALKGQASNRELSLKAGQGEVSGRRQQATQVQQ